MEQPAQEWKDSRVTEVQRDATSYVIRNSHYTVHRIASCPPRYRIKTQACLFLHRSTCPSWDTDCTLIRDNSLNLLHLSGRTRDSGRGIAAPWPPLERGCTAAERIPAEVGDLPLPSLFCCRCTGIKGVILMIAGVSAAPGAVVVPHALAAAGQQQRQWQQQLPPAAAAILGSIRRSQQVPSCCLQQRPNVCPQQRQVAAGKPCCCSSALPGTVCRMCTC